MPIPWPCRAWSGLCLGLAGCGATMVATPPPSQLPCDLSPAEFPGAAALLSGFDARTGASLWASGDRLLFGLRLARHDEVHRWLLRLEVELGQAPVEVTVAPGAGGAGAAARLEGVQLLPQGSWTYTIQGRGGPREQSLTSVLCPVHVAVFEADGRQIGSSTVHLPADLLQRGMLRAVDVERAAARAGAAKDASTAPAGSDDDAALERTRGSVEAIIAAMSLLNVVQQDDLLASYFWQVVEKPSIWSVIGNLGVAVTLSMPFESSVPAARLPPPLPPQERAEIIPLRIDVNGGPALFADVLATDPRRPFSLCGGMVAASARHPTDRGLRFDVQLLAARLGEAEPQRRPRR